MFEDVEHIERMSYEEYKKAIYCLNHPKEYEGNYLAFRDKLIDYGTRTEADEVPRYRYLFNSNDTT